MNMTFPIILCIGSDKIMGDSVGPVVGELLIKLYNIRCFVYGCVGQSVNGKNINNYLDFIKSVHPESPIIAIDACLSNQEKVGSIKILKGGVNPKYAITNRKFPVGDIGILGVVDNIKKNTLNTLLIASSDNIIKLSHKIAFIIYSAFLYQDN